MSCTAFVCPLSVRSASPVSQSHTLMLESSDADATELKTGWNASRETVARCPVSVCRAGSLGTQSAADRLDAGATRADESSSSS